MRFLTFLSTTTVILLANVGVAAACSYALGAGPIYWPETGQGATPAPTDTQIWFTVTDAGVTWEARLLDDQMNPVDVSQQRLEHPVYQGSAEIALTPLAPLSPNTTYTVEVDFDDAETDAVDAQWTFSTGAGAPTRATPAPPTEIRYYVVEEPVEDSCGGGGWETTYELEAPSVTTDEPLLYTFEVEAAEDTARQFHVIAPADAAMDTLVLEKAFGESTDTSPCVTLSVTDVTGQVSGAVSTCEPVGCLEGAFDSTPATRADEAVDCAVAPDPTSDDSDDDPEDGDPGEGDGAGDDSGDPGCALAGAPSAPASGGLLAGLMLGLLGLVRRRARSSVG